MDITFIAYILMTSLTIHTGRVIKWTESLAVYAEDSDKDASELRAIANEMASQRIKRGRLLGFIIFAGMVAMLVLSFFIWDFRVFYDDNPYEIPERAILILAVTDLCAVCLFGLFKIYRVDDIQCRFTDVFVKVMGDDTLSEPMVSNIGKNKLRIQIVLVAMAAVSFLVLNQILYYIEAQNIETPQIPQITMILGLYFTFLFFYVIHILNKHIGTVWKYEDRLIKWMAEREGAKRIVALQTESKVETDLWGRSLGKISWLYKIAKWLKRLYDLAEI